jgi:hypothetical protein
MTRAVLLTAGVLAVLLAGGCRVEKVVEGAGAMWSEDDAALLVAAGESTVTTGYMGHMVSTEPGPWKWWIYEMQTGELTPLVEGDGRDRFGAWGFMWRAGYVIGIDGDSSGFAQRLVRMDLDGARSSISWDADHVYVSPEGSKLARDRYECEEEGTRRLCRHWIEFFDATTLDPLGMSGELTSDSSTELRTDDWQGWWPIWHPSGDFIVMQEHRGLDGIGEAVALAPGEPPRRTEIFCDAREHPHSSSSDIAADGRRAEVRLRGGEPVITIVPPAARPGYPGDCFR